MGQQRNSIVFNEGNDKHLKLVGKLYDEVVPISKYSH